MPPGALNGRARRKVQRCRLISTKEQELKAMNIWKVCALVIFATGCVSQRGQMDRNAPFSAGSDTALVMFGVDIQSSFKSPTLTFLQFDPTTRHALKSSYSAEPRIDKLTDGQKFAGAMTGQNALPGGHNYFVISLPPGEWLLYQISGFYSDGAYSYSSTTSLSKGTIVVSAHAGTATYVGEFLVTGRYGEDMRLTVAPANFVAAKNELATFKNVKQELIESIPHARAFSCSDTQGVLGKTQCYWASVVVDE
jgi:hypothetical protein